jgi:hypothetical protein
MKFQPALNAGRNIFSPKFCLKCFAGEMFTAAKQLLGTARNNSNGAHLRKMEL